MLSRFWDKVDRSAGADACWAWTASTDTSGYGLFRWNGRLWKAHRLALVLSGRLPVIGQQACHSCDTRHCCNPAHLRWDTQQSNVDDRQARDRWVRGRGNQRITQAQAKELRRRVEAGELAGHIAPEYGISYAHAYKVAKGASTYV